MIHEGYKRRCEKRRLKIKKKYLINITLLQNKYIIF